MELEGGGGERRDYLRKAAGFYLWKCADRQWRSWLIPIFADANVVVFAVTMYVNNCPSHHHYHHHHHPAADGYVLSFLGRFSFEPLRDNPFLGPSRLSASFESSLGCWCLQNSAVRIGIIYVLSGFGSSVLSCLFFHDDISMGASGSIYGLLGAMLSELLINWTLYTHRVVEVCILLNLIVTTIVITMKDPKTDNFGHIGGAITGFLLGFVLMVRPHIGWFTRWSLPYSTTDIG